MLTVSVALGGMGPDFEASVAKFSDHWFPFPSWTLKSKSCTVRLPAFFRLKVRFVGEFVQ